MKHIGRFEIRGEIARGGMGVVYRAWDPEAGRNVAIKVILSGPNAAKREARFRIEGEALARLSHPNLVKVHSLDVSEGGPYLVMDLIQGETLLARVQRDGPLDPTEAVQMALKLAEALEHAHQSEVIHRDVKPGNVLLDSEGEPRLVDFGLVKLLDHDLRLTAPGMGVGTPGFASPEQSLGKTEQIGPASDVYGLGATLYYMLTGVPPFLAHSLGAGLIEAPESPSELRPDLDPQLDVICLRCLEKRPRDRYPTAEALASALTEFLYRSPQPRRLGLPGALVALLAVVGGVVAWSARGKPGPAEWPSSVPTKAEATPSATESDRIGPSREKAEVLFKQGNGKFTGGDHEGAIESYTQAIELSPDYVEAYVNRGIVLHDQGDYKAATEDYAHVLAIDPTLANVYGFRARARSYLGDFAGALEDYTQLLAIDPEHAVAYNSRGVLREQLGIYEGAIDDFTKAIEIDPYDSVCHSNRGYARAKLGDYEGAIIDQQKALDLLSADDPNRSHVEELLGEAQRLLRDSIGGS